MELADPRLLRQLTETYKRGEARHRRASCPQIGTSRTLDLHVYQAPLGNSRRCRCGECFSCKENARWERIFAEKFADPHYYTGAIVRHGSPISTLAISRAASTAGSLR
jgi:hypothetical protein